MLLHKLKQTGYTTYVEPSVGGFAMPLVAVDNGWSPSEMSSTDVSLYSSALGYLISGRDLNELQVAVDKTLIPLKGTPEQQAAEILWTQLLVRTQVKPVGEYWNQMIRDLTERKEEHIESLVSQLGSMRERLAGMEYKPQSIWEHIEEIRDIKGAVVISNPPTYKGAYEKFFDTKGRMTWDAPEYPIFDAPKDIPKMVQMFEGREALLIVQQQQTPRNAAHPKPIFARHLGKDQNVYINTNRPDELLALQGGLVIRPRTPSADTETLPYPVLPEDYVITEKSRLDMTLVPSLVADRYRGMWMHRLVAEGSGTSVLFLIDGYAAGIAAFNVGTMANSYNAKWERHPILRFAFGAKTDNYRLTRLATMMALRKSTLKMVETPSTAIFVEASQGLVTIEMTQHPESKGLRGLMKLDSRTKHLDGYRLIYGADWLPAKTNQEILKEFLVKERQWQKSRK